MTATELAVVPSEDILEQERKLVRSRQCVEAGCDKPATRQDGRCAKHSAFRLTRAAIRRAAAEHLERNAVKYAKAHMRAAEIAALEGDGKPAEWGLVHSGAIKPVEKAPSGPGGVQVFVGVTLPGLKEGA